MSKPYVVAGYVADAGLPDVTGEDLGKLTHLNVAFGHVREDEIRIDHLARLDELTRFKTVNPDLVLLLSVGGWGAGGFSEAASTEEGRRRMAQSAVNILLAHPFDGIDLDWEYPCYSTAGIQSSPEDKRNFTLLLQTIREAIDEQGRKDGRRYLLTIAVGADQYYLDGTEMDQVHRYLDFLQVMTYDMRGGFQVLTGHHTNLYNSTGDLFRISTDTSINLYLAAGVPRDKIVVGAAFYSRQWEKVPDAANGLHQIAGGSGGYGPDYTTLANDYINKNGYVRYWDAEAKAPYLFNGSTFITYDDEESLEHKCRYVEEKNLAGIMFWEYGCDKTRRLLDSLYRGLNKPIDSASKTF
ncbi:glycoside hydrolase family 18 protein [Paenibacillus sp. GbtcB18]|uniref:glycoside hydrolase family 18 protein n=1 Tax=Paenibacillus sp. GbtcB18 TaxID=2824763 RepID=UPI001C2F24C5|nr:glycoside hydrolase family 18 protein [Paenibacillus sp. GbtcB18]